MNPHAKAFKNKGFSHFDTIDQIMPHGLSTARGKFTKRQPRAPESVPLQGQASESSSSVAAVPLPASGPWGAPPTSSTATASATQARADNTMNFTQLVAATDEIRHGYGGPGPITPPPPTAIPPSQWQFATQGIAPLSPLATGTSAVSSYYASSTSDSGMTSVSRQAAKRKSSALGDDSGNLNLQLQSSRKRSRPPSATAMAQVAQQESSAAMVSMAGAFPQIIQSLNAPLPLLPAAVAGVVSDRPPPTDLGRAINLLTQSADSESEELNMDQGDLMDLMDYFSSNPSAATVFANTDSAELRVRWARRRLSIIRGGNSS